MVKSSNSMKKCNKCKIEKEIEKFAGDKSTKDGLHVWCKDCHKEYRKNNKEEIAKQKKYWYENNKDRERERARRYYKSNKEERCKYRRQYYENNKEEEANRSKKYWKNNKKEAMAQHNQYISKRRKNDHSFKLICNIRTRLSSAIKNNYKSGSAVRDLGCSINFLRGYLEAQFYPHQETGEMMSWDNYGKWHVDHKTPLSFFDLEDREQFLQAVHFSNLQPMWAKENIRKSNKC